MKNLVPAISLLEDKQKTWQDLDLKELQAHALMTNTHISSQIDDLVFLIHLSHILLKQIAHSWCTEINRKDSYSEMAEKKAKRREKKTLITWCQRFNSAYLVQHSSRGFVSWWTPFFPPLSQLFLGQFNIHSSLYNINGDNISILN